MFCQICGQPITLKDFLMYDNTYEKSGNGQPYFVRFYANGSCGCEKLKYIEIRVQYVK